MTKVTINLNKVENIKKFISVVNTFESDIDISSGRILLDAKSIMALYSLDLSKDIDIISHANTEDEIQRFKAEMRKFTLEMEV